MNIIEFCWLTDFDSQKTALQDVLGCSGQLLKKHFSSKELSRPIKAKSFSRLPLDLVNHLLINPIYQGPRPSILSETQEYLVLHKPPFVHSHPLKYTDQDTLINFLVEEGKWDALNVNVSNYDRGLLYRLDFETSGLMIVAKNEKFLAEMRQDFNQKMKSKWYWAIVEGNFDKEGRWTHYFRATGVKGAKQVVSPDYHSSADEGILQVKNILHQDGKSLVLVKLKTGLRHQIRAQLAALGFPLLGDELYGGRKAERLFLHALRYEWSESAEDYQADLFDRFFDLNRALQVSHDMFRVF